MNYREAWANGEIEAGTLVDCIEQQALEIERFKSARSEKGSRKALGEINAKLRAKVGSLERELAALSANHSEQVPVAYVDDHYLDQLRRGRGFSIGVTPALHRRDGENNALYTKPCAGTERIIGELAKAKELLEECITTLYCQSSAGGEVLDRVNAFLAAAPSAGSQGGDV